MAQVIVNFVRDQFKSAHEWLEGTIDGVTPELVNEKINPKAMTIGGQYAHIVYGVDALVFENFGKKETLAKTTWKDKTGISEIPDARPMAEWQEDVQVELTQTKQYCSAVFKAVDDYLSTLSDDELGQKIDIPEWGMNQVIRSTILNMAMFNVMAHTGEIAFMKGMKGLKGYAW